MALRPGGGVESGRIGGRNRLLFDDTGTGGLTLNYLVLEGTISVSIHSGGVVGGFNELPQLAELTNVLTTVTLKGSQPFTLGSPAGASNAGDGVVTFGDTPGGVTIYAGATTRAVMEPTSLTKSPTKRSPTPVSRSRVARGAISSRTTPRTVSSPMVTAPIQSSWAEPVKRPPWDTVPSMEEIMALLFLQGDGFIYHGLGSLPKH